MARYQTEVGAGTTIHEHARIGPDVVLGRGVKVRPRARLRQAVLGDDEVVAPWDRVHGSIIVNVASVTGVDTHRRMVQPAITTV